MARWNNEIEEALRGFGLGYKGGKMAQEAMHTRGASDAYKFGEQQTETTTGDEAIANFKANYTPQEGGPANAEAYMQQNPEAFAGLGERQRSYQVGDATQATPFTRNQQRQAGLQAKGDYYSANQEDERANALYDQAEQLKSSGLRTKAMENQLADYDRVTRARENFDKQVKDPYAYAQELFNKDLVGGKDMAGKKMEFKRTNGGAMAWLVDDDGKAILDDKGSPQARHFTEAQVKDIALKGYLAQLGPEKLAEYERGMAKDASEASYKEGTLKRYEDMLAETSRHNKAMEGRPLGGGAGGGAGSMQRVSWTDASGKKQTGLIGMERVGKKFVPYDPQTGKELAADDPRSKAAFATGQDNIDPMEVVYQQRVERLMGNKDLPDAEMMAGVRAIQGEQADYRASKRLAETENAGTRIEMISELAGMGKDDRALLGMGATKEEIKAAKKRGKPTPVAKEGLSFNRGDPVGSWLQQFGQGYDEQKRKSALGQQVWQQP